MTDSSSTLGQSTKLEIAHVLFTDIVGYSGLPLDHQKEVLGTLQAVVSSTAEFLLAQTSQQMIRLPTGDGMAVVFFEDAEAAARCAIEVSRALKSHPEIPLRMGLHSGPVYRVADINANQNVAGGGINIAQRVMDCGDAGHILASQSVADVLGYLSSWKSYLHDLGETDVKHGVHVHLYNLYTDEVGNAELPRKLQTEQRTAATLHSKAKTKKIALGIVAAGAIVGLTIGWFLYPRHAHTLTDKDTIVLADFTNMTGDAVFDGTLRQGLSVQLEQSPFLSLVSDERIQQTLRLMDQSPDAKLTPSIAREVCQRTGSAAVLDGSIASLGTQYVLGLKALSCRTGDTLAEEQGRASGKGEVLAALDKVATSMRGKLGESLSTVEKFDTPLAQATTSSLEALQAYSIGMNCLESDPSNCVPSYQRAIRLDPNFAMAYSALGIFYSQHGENSLAATNAKKAYELRGRVSEREKFAIESAYYALVTGDLEKARRVSELWVQTYPRDGEPLNRLAGIDLALGQYDKAPVEEREYWRLSPKTGLSYAMLANVYVDVDHLEEARATTKEAEAKKLDAPLLHVDLYYLAFLQNDSAGMKQQVAWAAGMPVVENVFVAYEADTAAYAGRLLRAREFSHRAVASAVEEKAKETAASYEAQAALREAYFGNAVEARQRAAAALKLSVGRDVQFGAALAVALTGDAARAQALADDLSNRFSEDTMVRFNYLPTLHAQLALSRRDAPKAIELLQAAAPYELGSTGSNIFSPCLYPVYVRGEAYLAAQQGDKAASEFQKVLDHRGVVFNEAIGALAYLGLARAYVLQGDTAKARAAYQDFLTLWKDADPNIPILIAAKFEYAKLR